MSSFIQRTLAQSLGPIVVFEINERHLRVASLGIPVVLRLLPNDHSSPARRTTAAPRGLRHAADAMVVTDLGRMSRARWAPPKISPQLIEHVILNLALSLG